MLVDVRLHSASAALHWQLGSEQLGNRSAAAVHVTQAGHSPSSLDSTSAHVVAEP
jgi:hypothetical protein